MNRKSPKIIWIFWYQGLLQAPNIVKTCMFSWQLHHPDYDVKILDKTTIHEYIDIPDYINLERPDFNIQMYSDYIRLALLQKYGGIWVDANIYCFQPLKNWLPKLLNEKIFLFESSFKDRLNVNWFIAATPNHYIINQWQKIHAAFFRENQFKATQNTLTISIITKLIGVSNQKTKWWFSFFVRKILNVYPYFVMHYLFNQLYYKDARITSTWDNVPKVNACHSDMRCQRINNISFDNFYSKYKKGEIHLLKLTHRITNHHEHYKKYIDLVNKDFKQSN